MKVYIVAFTLQNNFKVHVLINNQNDKDIAERMARSAIYNLQQVKGNHIHDSIREINMKTSIQTEIWNAGQERIINGSKQFIVYLNGQAQQVFAGGIKSAYLNMHRLLQMHNMDKQFPVLVIVELRQEVKPIQQTKYIVTFELGKYLRKYQRVYVVVSGQNFREAKQQSIMTVNRLRSKNRYIDYPDYIRDGESSSPLGHLLNEAAGSLIYIKEPHAVEVVSNSNRHSFSGRQSKCYVFFDIEKCCLIRDQNYQYDSYIEEVCDKIPIGVSAVISNMSISSVEDVLEKCGEGDWSFAQKSIGGLVILVESKCELQESEYIKHIEEKKQEAERKAREEEKKAREEEKKAREAALKSELAEIEKKCKSELAEIEKKYEEEKKAREDAWADYQRKREEEQKAIEVEHQKQEEVEARKKYYSLWVEYLFNSNQYQKWNNSCKIWQSMSIQEKDYEIQKAQNFFAEEKQRLEEERRRFEIEYRKKEEERIRLEAERLQAYQAVEEKKRMEEIEWLRKGRSLKTLNMKRDIVKKAQRVKGIVHSSTSDVINTFSYFSKKR